MKLFLASMNVDIGLQSAFFALVGKEAKDIKFALIENAADPYPSEQRSFVLATRQAFKALGVQVTLLDLRYYQDHQERLYAKLKDFDVVWLGGGNTYYLRWLLQVTGFENIIAELLDNGLTYGGGSAGSIVACPVLDEFDMVDSIELAPEPLYQGLNLIDFVVIPHWQDPEYQRELVKIKAYYEKKTEYLTVTIEDGQAVVVNGDAWGIYPEST